MLVLTYFLGALFQVLGSYGLTRVIQFYAKRSPIKKSFTASQAFAWAMMSESLFLSFLSASYASSSSVLTTWFYLKLGLGAVLLLRFDFFKIKNWVLQHKLIAFWFCCLLAAASLPTSSFDAFTAHFSIARLFVEVGGLPIRPDYQYLEALPLSAHMWLLPGMAAGWEGALNMVFPLFSVALIVLIEENWGRKCALWSTLLLLSMPEYIRISLDPMVDTASFFYALLGIAFMREHLRDCEGTSLFKASLSWFFLLGIKQSLLGFIPLLIIPGGAYLIKRKWLCKNLILAILIIIVVGGFWHFRTWVIRGNPFYPYLFSGDVSPYIPEEYRPPVRTFSLGLAFEYFKILFMDYRWSLSLGPWPLALLPVLFIRSKWQKLFLYTFLILVVGLLVTYTFTPFKNRYALPYLIIFIPWMAGLVGRSGKSVRILLKCSAVFVCLSFLPYIAMFAVVAAKNMDYEEYYRYKFYNYESVSKANTLNDGRILFVATPIYWLKNDPVFSVYSETYIDYTRLKSSEDFFEKIKKMNIRYLVFDEEMIAEMATYKDPYYSAKKYTAICCLQFMKGFFDDPRVKTLWSDKGVRVGEIFWDRELEENR